MRRFLAKLAAPMAVALKVVIGVQCLVVAYVAAALVYGWPLELNWRWGASLGRSVEAVTSLVGEVRQSPDPIAPALARDRDRLERFAVGLSHNDRNAWIESVAPTMAAELDVAATYENQTGAIDYFYRDAEFLRVEALLRGVTAARIQIAESRRQAQDLRTGAEQALALTYELETPEALDLLERHLWSDDNLIQAGRLDPHTHRVVGDIARQWGPSAASAIDDYRESLAQMVMQQEYLAAIRTKLLLADGPFPTAIGAKLHVPGRLTRNHTFRDRDAALESVRAAAQVPAIALVAIADNRLVVLDALDDLAVRISGVLAMEFVDSFAGLYDTPRSLWQYARRGQESMIRGRLRETVFDPASVSHSLSVVQDRVAGLPRLVQARLLDEAERSSEARLTAASGMNRIGDLPTVDGDEITDQLKTRALLGAADLAATAGEVVLGTSLLLAPEPVISKVVGVIALAVAAADIAWESTKVYPTYQQGAAMRSSLVNSISGAVLGIPAHPACILDPGTVVSPGVSTPTSGALLEAELALWRQLKRVVSATGG